MKSATGSILVVDDDRDTCLNLSDILSDLGYQVDTAHDGASALEMAKRRPYDVAILDFKMPGMDGLTLYRELRRLRSATVAVVVTAFAGPHTTEEVLAAGAWRLFRKPVNPLALLKVVDEAMDQPLVLVVDDDTDLCANLCDLLRERSFRVAVANDEQAATSRLSEQSFDVVLIDLRLPDADGTSVFRKVREANPQARTVLITGFRSEMAPAIDNLMAEGADGVCYKPFDIPNLLKRLRELTHVAG